MVKTADGKWGIRFGQSNAKFLGRSAAKACARLTRATTTTGQNFTSLRISSSAPFIHIIAVVLSNEFTDISVQLDQEVTRRVKLDESL